MTDYSQMSDAEINALIETRLGGTLNPYAHDLNQAMGLLCNFLSHYDWVYGKVFMASERPYSHDPNRDHGKHLPATWKMTLLWHDDQKSIDVFSETLPRAICEAWLMWKDVSELAGR